jgi:hypothetical protein
MVQKSTFRKGLAGAICLVVLSLSVEILIGFQGFFQVLMKFTFLVYFLPKDK